MFGLFGSRKKSKKKRNVKNGDTNITKNMSDAEKSAALREQVQRQIAQKRAEMDPEALEKLQQLARIKQAKQKVRSYVDDEDRRSEVINKIREMQENERNKE